MQPCGQWPQNVQPCAAGTRASSRSFVRPAVPCGCRIAFSCGRYAAPVMSFDVWCGSPSLAAPREEPLFLRPHRRRLNRQRVLDPLVVRDQFAVTERRDVIPVVRIRVGAVRSPRKLPASREASWRSSARSNRRHPPSARGSSSAAGRVPRAAGCGRRGRSGRRRWPDCSPRSRSATTRARCARSAAPASSRSTSRPRAASSFATTGPPPPAPTTMTSRTGIGGFPPPPVALELLAPVRRRRRSASAASRPAGAGCACASVVDACSE